MRSFPHDYSMYITTVAILVKVFTVNFLAFSPCNKRRELQKIILFFFALLRDTEFCKGLLKLRNECRKIGQKTSCNLWSLQAWEDKRCLIIYLLISKLHMRLGPSLQKLWCLVVRIKKVIFLPSLVWLMVTLLPLAAFLSYRRELSLEVNLHCHLSSSLFLCYGLAGCFIVLQAGGFCYHSVVSLLGKQTIWNPSA